MILRFYHMSSLTEYAADGNWFHGRGIISKAANMNQGEGSRRAHFRGAGLKGPDERPLIDLSGLRVLLSPT